MKSEPVRSATSAPTSTVGSASFGGIAGTVAGRAAKFCCAAPATPVLATQVATPPTAAPFRNLRRSTRLFLDFFTAGISSWALCVLPAVCVEGSPKLAALYPSSFLAAVCITRNVVACHHERRLHRREGSAVNLSAQRARVRSASPTHAALACVGVLGVWFGKIQAAQEASM